jgi:CubicO group peptidase (beta-lactamase class C family)
VHQLIRSSLFALIALLSISISAQQAIDPAVIRSFEQFAEREMKRDGTTGLSVAVLQGDRLWARGFGFADIENQVPATEKSSYRMASVSKPMTAVAALKLAEMGKLDLDTDIQKYVPYFPKKNKPVTVRQLLSHLGGISHYRDYRVEGNIREPKTTREAIAIFENFDLINEPGSAYSYSSYGYNLVGAAIEGASGRNYADVMQELVWEPAGMSDTRMDSPTDLIPHRVTGYRLEDGELKRSSYVDISSRFAAGGTRSTVVDMVRFAKAVDEGKLLNTEWTDRMWSSAQTTAQRLVHYGLGWSVFSVNGHYQVNHSGSQQETRTLLIYFPAKDLAMAFASNFEEADFGAYRDQLYWLLTGELWNPPMYASDRADQLTLLLADRLVDAGGLYYEKYGRPVTTDRRALDRAFAYVRDAMREKDPALARKMIEDGLHPVSGQPLVLAGSWIVSKTGIEGTPVSVLARYNGSPRLDRAVQQRSAELARELARVLTSEQKRLFVDRPADADLEQAIASFRGLRVAPSHADTLVDDAQKSFMSGDMARAMRLSRLASEAYPADDSAAGVHGVLLVLAGNEAEGEAWLRRSKVANPDGYASPQRLAAIAREVGRAGHRDRAVTLLRVGMRIDPESKVLKDAFAAVQ